MKPTAKDAEILIQLEALRFSKPLEEAFAWFFREMADAPTMSESEFEAKCPKGSEALKNVQYIGQFFETVGTLAKHGLINTDLLFDRYYLVPFWEKLNPRIEKERGDAKEIGPALGENFEWLANANKAWLKAHLRRMKGRR